MSFESGSYHQLTVMGVMSDPDSGASSYFRTRTSDVMSAQFATRPISRLTGHNGSDSLFSS
jgi:hypothetical protein